MFDNNRQGSEGATNAGGDGATPGGSDGEGGFPLTRRAVLQGAAAAGPVAAAGSNAFVESASAAAGGGEAVTVTSPDGSVEATVSLGSSDDIDDDIPDGRIALLTARYDGTTVLEPSPLGLTTFDEQFVTDVSPAGRKTRTIAHSYETVGGDESGERTLRARVATIAFRSADGDDAMKLDVLASNEGIAYRYRLPGDGHVIVDKEASAFQIPGGSTAWLHEYNDRYESIWEETDVESAGGNFGFPGLFEVADGAYALLTEANVGGNYCASHLSVDAAGTETGDDAPREESLVGAEGDRDEIVAGDEEFDYDENPTLFELRFAGTYDLPQTVDATLPMASPWRVAIVGDLPTVVESDLVAALNEPSKIEDTSWIEPGIVDWSWWSDGDSPRDLEIQKRYVDYAAEQGWEYTLVDRGWRREWMPELVAYANERGVDILVWMVWYDLDTETKRETLLSRLNSWGVSGVKIDYMNADRQDRMRWYDEVLEATAEHELLVNFHGSTVPKGRRRTWPHLMTSEAIYGAEQYKFEEIPPSHNVILPFTRNVVGPMDYTPVTFSATDEPPRTTLGHELALSVVYQSDLQHFADSVESYRSHPIAERFLREVSATWDETRFVGGRPAEEATMARRDGDRWFLGSIVAGDGRTVEVPLSFLPDDRRYAVTVVDDARDGSGLRERTRYATSNATVAVRVRENGGFAARITPCE